MATRALLGLTMMRAVAATRTMMRLWTRHTSPATPPPPPFSGHVRPWRRVGAAVVAVAPSSTAVSVAAAAAVAAACPPRRGHPSPCRPARAARSRLGLLRYPPCWVVLPRRPQRLAGRVGTCQPAVRLRGPQSQRLQHRQPAPLFLQRHRDDRPPRHTCHRQLCIRRRQVVAIRFGCPHGRLQSTWRRQACN